MVDAPEPEVVHEGRRTIRINGRPGEVSEIAPFTSTARRRRPPRTVEERLAGDPTRDHRLGVLLGLLLILSQSLPHREVAESSSASYTYQG